MYTKEEINLITLSQFSCLSYEDIKTLLSDFTSSEPEFEKCGKIMIKLLSAGLYNKVRSLFYDVTFRQSAIRSLSEKGITCVTYFSPAYPENLKNIYNPPAVLYCKGDVSLLKSSCFSVVGSRRSTPKTLADCNKISGELSTAFTVVTGLADGADSAALEGALDAGGKVISVLANGFERIYPACNAKLFERVCRNGLAVTEYLPDVCAKPYHFPLRNRIIAGLSHSTLVVSAGEKSGALITANYANNYGRNVYAFPHSLGVASGKGCNGLIKEGAILVENILDIFKDLGLDFKAREQKVILTDDERAAFSAVREEDVAFLPEIAAKLSKQPYELIPVITSLQIKKLVTGLGGNRYIAK